MPVYTGHSEWAHCRCQAFAYRNRCTDCRLTLGELKSIVQGSTELVCVGRLGAGTRAIALVSRRAGLGLGLLSVEQGEGFVEGLFDNAGQ